jgi:hypothetical protein
MHSMPYKTWVLPLSGRRFWPAEFPLDFPLLRFKSVHPPNGIREFWFTQRFDPVEFKPDCLPPCFQRFAVSRVGHCGILAISGRSSCHE